MKQQIDTVTHNIGKKKNPVFPVIEKLSGGIHVYISGFN